MSFIEPQLATSFRPTPTVRWKRKPTPMTNYIGKPVNQEKESGVVELQKAGSPAQFSRKLRNYNLKASTILAKSAS